METENDRLTLNIAATSYLAELDHENNKTSQQEIYSFIRWCGRDKLFDRLTASQVERYSKQISSSERDYLVKINAVKGFLKYAGKQKWTSSNLAVHLKPNKKKKIKSKISNNKQLQSIEVTQEGYDNMLAEMKELKNRRLDVIEEMRKAAADKDFRENAPLQAAREQRGMIEGRIIELEANIKAAVIVDTQGDNSEKATVGDKIILKNIDKGSDAIYYLVGPREVDPLHGKVSISSPIGKAVLGHVKGDKIEILVPAGKIHCLIEDIEK